MASIPLHCNICPKEPEFSDISHLLTHVASKGHLAQQFKAQVRARQDASIRARLDAYDRWYDRYQIEKLLSERMIAKDSKDFSSRATKNNVNPVPAELTRHVNSRKRRPRRLAKSEDQASPVKLEQALDPQLSRSLPVSRSRSRQPSALTEQSLSEEYDSQREFLEHLSATPRPTRPSAFLSQPYHGYSSRTYIPRMSEWQGASSPHRATTETTSANGTTNNKPPPMAYDTDGESDYFETFLRSPTRTAYPDPSEVAGQCPDISDDPVIVQDSMAGQSGLGADTKDSSIKEGGSALQSPVLKGVKWPGMSLFDSASLDAQRLRNQKKDDSVLEQMEHNSAMVEQMERIYWPDGSLKKQRLITGNVDSSPIKEPTPPPKLPRRKRAKVLQEMSANAPVLGKKPRTRKAAPSGFPNQVSDLRTVSRKALAEVDASEYVYSSRASVGYEAPNDQECERKLTLGLPVLGQKKAFHIFNDHTADTDDAQSQFNIRTSYSGDSQSLHGHQSSQSSLQSRVPDFALHRRQMSRPQSEDYETPWGAHLHTPKGLSRGLKDGNSENIPPVLNGDGRINSEAAPIHTQRVTQRYFSVTGNQPPEFFSSMPPGMDFGGLMQPRYHGSTLNPLNLYLSRQRFAQSPSPSRLPSPMAPLPGGSARRQETREKPDSRNRILTNMS